MAKVRQADGTIVEVSEEYLEEHAAVVHGEFDHIPFNERVNKKREELIIAGTTITVSGYGEVSLQGRPEDQSTLHGLAFAAQLRLSAGDTTTLTDFLDRENVLHQLTPMQMITVWQMGASFMSSVYARSWEIKAMNPETTVVEDDAVWFPE